MIEVRIKDVDGSLKPYYIDENSTIRILKEQIQRDEGHDAAKQVLLSCGQRLEGLCLSKPATENPLSIARLEDTKLLQCWQCAFHMNDASQAVRIPHS